MMFRSAVVVTALLVTVAVPGGEAAAQYHPSQPPVYRGSQPSPAYDSGPPAGGYFGENDGSDDNGTALPPPGLSSRPSRILPYPEEADVAAPPAPAFASPDGQPESDSYGHELGSASGPAGGPDVIRPPAPVGGVPAAGLASSPQG